MTGSDLGDPIGVGRTAEVYDWGEGRVLKLLLPGLPDAWIDHEAGITRLAHAAGAPAPAVHEVIRVDGRPGIVFDRAGDRSALALIQEAPWRGTTLAGRLADIHAGLFRCRSSDLPAVKERLAAKIDSADALPADHRRRAKDALGELPGGDSVLHGDLHPDNVFLTGTGAVIIDWSEASRGHPGADIARSLITMAPTAIPPDLPRRRALRLLVGGYRWRYLGRCLRRAGLDRADVEPWHLPVTAARLSEQIDHEVKPLVARVARMLGASP
jgi:hypothetical protein